MKNIQETLDYVDVLIDILDSRVRSIVLDPVCPADGSLDLIECLELLRCESVESKTAICLI